MTPEGSRTWPRGRGSMAGTMSEMRPRVGLRGRQRECEALGWTESKIIARFWIAGLVLALFALTTLKLR